MRQREREQQRHTVFFMECIAVQQQDGEPTSAPIDNLYELLRLEGALQLWAIPQLWQILITCTLHTLWMWVTEPWLHLFDIPFNLSGCVYLMHKKAISHSTLPHTCDMLCVRAFSCLFHTLDIDYLALVDPVDVKTFWIHLHGDRNGLCGVLDGDKGISFRTRFGQKKELLDDD